MDVLSVIPDDPEFLPSVPTQQMAMALFSSFVHKAGEVGAEQFDEVTYIDQGENFHSVTCPACGADLADWWQEAMQTASDKQFSDLMVTVPCCGAEGSLNDLNYDWPAGFARFRLKAVDPIQDIGDPQIGMLSNILGCGLRKIWAHY